jgi:DNA-binding NarL/FixJ family response regulator
MRVILVGPASARAFLRTTLRERGIDVLAEASTLAAARDAGMSADAFVLASNDGAAELAAGDADVVDEPLTPREIEVLELLAEGFPNKAIAARLEISDQTVKFHVSSICAKLEAANRTEAVRKGVRRGLIRL